MEQELKVVSFLFCVASWHLNPDLRAREMSSLVLFSKPFYYDEGQASFLLSLCFPGLEWPSHLSLPGLLVVDGEVGLSPAVLAPGSHSITKHVALRHLSGSTERAENLILVAWPRFSGGISGNIGIPILAGEIFHPTQWALLN